MLQVKCPHCQAPYSLKEEFAGRQATCRACQKPFTVTAPTAPAAARAPATVPPAAPAKPPAARPVAAPASKPAPPSKPAAAPARPTGPTIELTCMYCEAELHLPADMENKQVPCPECKRIIRVPTRAKAEPLDWRKGEGRRASALKKEEPATPQGAWDTSVATVSREALVEAAVIPEEREPRTFRWWLRRAILLFFVVILAGGTWTLVTGYFVRQQQDKVLALALQAIPPGQLATVPPPAAMEIHRAIGEYYLRANERDLAQSHLGAARGYAQLVPASAERDALLLDLAVVQAGLIRAQLEIDQASSILEAEDQQRQALVEVRSTLEQMQSVDARAEALRQITRQLAAKDQAGLAAGLAATQRGRSELIGVVGLELVRLGQGNVKELASRAHQEWEETKGLPPSSLVGLWVAVNEPDQARKFEPFDASCVAGLAEGYASAGKLAEARERVDKHLADPLDKLRGQVRLALVALSANPNETADVEAAVELAQSIPAGRLNAREEGRGDVSWLLLRLVQAAARAGQVGAAAKLVPLIPNAGLKGRGQLALLKAKLASSGTADPALADDIAADVQAHALARELIARHNARVSSSNSVLDAIRQWEPEELRAFGYAGAALGVQDYRRAPAILLDR